MYRPVLRSLLTVALLSASAIPWAAELIMVPMTDGVKLATDVHKPEGAGPWPVILLRSTYGRVGGGEKEWLEKGYAVVIQDTRGRGQSEGEKHVFYPDGWRPGLTDGADTVRWISEQPWCNGKIGTVGGSALGITQMLLAPATDNVQAQCIEVAASNFYPDISFPGGVWRKNLLEGWLSAVQEPHIIPVWKSHPYYDEFWRYFNTLEQTSKITAPALFVGAWQDIFAQGTLNGFVARQESAVANANGNNILIMKWGIHGPDVSKDYKFNENRFDLKVGKIREAFFEHWLKGNSDALDGVAKVNYYVLGADTPGAPGNEWRTAESWPPYPTTATKYYLHQDGALTVTPASESEASRSFTFDPNNPVPTHGGAELLLPAGPFDQRIVSNREDVLKFATAPLDAPLEVTGRMTARLFVSTDAPDTDFTAKLVDLYPAGDDREILMTDSIRRVKLRKSFEKPEPLLSGGEIVELEIDLFSIAWIFDTGHRIGLHVSSSNFQRFEVNPNTGADFPEDGAEKRKAVNTLWLDTAHPSHLELPLRE
ncbi:MAG: CocE/NonD family hydrolase [Candidatus Hydrogenedentes bacterium]|nr:CocE/NonD family hydrolase [Candidatus Hydrogenedentota bacterium]